MRATDHLKMPELIMSEYTVQLSEAEHKKYSDLRQELVLSLPDCEVTAANAASLSNSCRRWRMVRYTMTPARSFRYTTGS